MVLKLLGMELLIKGMFQPFLEGGQDGVFGPEMGGSRGELLGGVLTGMFLHFMKELMVKLMARSGFQGVQLRAYAVLR